MKIKKLLFISKDPGGVNALIPIIKKCQKSKKFKCNVFSHKLTENMYKEERIPYLPLEKFNYFSKKKNAVEKILFYYKPDIIITGSSRPHYHEPVTPEQLFIKYSKTRNINSISILDYWGNYIERFSIYGGQLNYQFVPDKICALDKMSMKLLIDVGINKKNIIITHNPFYDSFVKKTVRQKHKQNNQKSEHNILFVSQPLIEAKQIYNQGFTQFEIFDYFLTFLNQWKCDKPKNILIWLHPKENKKKWNKIVDYARSDLIKITVDETRSKKIFESIDFVVSAFSTVLYQSLYYLLPTISIQIGLNKKDQLITNELNLSIPLYRKEDLYKFANNFDINLSSKMLTKRKKCLQNKKIFFSDGLATDKIIKLINNFDVKTGE